MADDRYAKQDMLTDLGNILDRAQFTGLCANCGMGMMGDNHLCDPERSGNAMVARAWRYHLGASPQKRAKGYAVQ